MRVEIQQALTERKPLADIANAATPVLEDAIGNRATHVTAHWGYRVDEHGRPLITLQLADWSEQASAEFAPEELQEPNRARGRFYRVWGDLLQRTSERITKELKAVAAEDIES